MVIDIDWFEFKNEKHLKQLAYASEDGTESHPYTFTLPPKAHHHAKDLIQQARFSHKLCWNSPGVFDWWQVSLVINRVKQRFPNARFFAKGHEKCLLLEEYGLDMNDLNECGCPVYKALTRERQTTLSKALTFALWLASPT